MKSYSNDYQRGYQAGYHAGLRKKGCQTDPVFVEVKPPYPWAAKANGAWNGDMFYDWVHHDIPSDDPYYDLHEFLRGWEKRILKEMFDVVTDHIIRKF